MTNLNSSNQALDCLYPSPWKLGQIRRFGGKGIVVSQMHFLNRSVRHSYRHHFLFLVVPVFFFGRVGNH